MRTQSSTQSWIDVTNLCLGVILFCLPWFIVPTTQAIEWNAWIAGGLVGFNAGCALTGFAAWEEWTNLIVGLWVAISPWLFGFQANVAATWTYVVLGSCVAVLAAVQLWLANRQSPGVIA
jgi:hypothetical protein